MLVVCCDVCRSKDNAGVVLLLDACREREDQCAWRACCKMAMRMVLHLGLETIGAVYHCGLGCHVLQARLKPPIPAWDSIFFRGFFFLKERGMIQKENDVLRKRQMGD